MLKIHEGQILDSFHKYGTSKNEHAVFVPVSSFGWWECSGFNRHLLHKTTFGSVLKRDYQFWVKEEVKNKSQRAKQAYLSIRKNVIYINGKQITSEGNEEDLSRFDKTGTTEGEEYTYDTDIVIGRVKVTKLRIVPNVPGAKAAFDVKFLQVAIMTEDKRTKELTISDRALMLALSNIKTHLDGNTFLHIERNFGIGSMIDSNIFHKYIIKSLAEYQKRNYPVVVYDN